MRLVGPARLTAAGISAILVAVSDIGGGSARVTVLPSGDSQDLVVGQVLAFGRDVTNALSFPGEPRLSRRAGELTSTGDGVVVANVGRTHSLFVELAGGSAELEPHDTGAASAFVVRHGVATVSVPWPDSACRLLVEVPGARARLPDLDPPTLSPLSTARPVRLDEQTKLFATALLLCRPRLTAGSGVLTVTPTVPDLALELLRVTDSFHLIAAFEQGDAAVRDKLTARVHDQLKELRVKLLRHGLAPPETSLSAAALAELLVRHRIVTRQQLPLLTDPEWRSAQYEKWWS